MTHQLEIWIENGGRILDAIVEVNANYHDATYWTSPSCDYSWTCLSLTETLEDGEVITLNPKDYEAEIDEKVGDLV